MQRQHLSGLRVIVTGSASGMGAAVLEALTDAGARVGAIDRDGVRGAQLAKRANERGGGTAAFAECDVASRDSVHDVFHYLVQDLGGLDALVHAAGIEGEGESGTLDEGVVRQMLRVNFEGTVWTNQAALPALRTAGAGSIINFASGIGVVGSPMRAHYAASKGAVLA